MGILFYQLLPVFISVLILAGIYTSTIKHLKISLETGEILKIRYRSALGKMLFAALLWGIFLNFGAFFG